MRRVARDLMVSVEMGGLSQGNYPLELIPILIAALIWGRAWSGQKVLCYCDNQVVVAAI